MKQTAVEFLIQQIVDRQNGIANGSSLDEIFQQAKELEKQQIIDAFETAFIEAYKKPIIGFVTDNRGQYRKFNSAGQYYSETYKNETE